MDESRKKDGGKKADAEEISIRDLPDLRKLRKTFLTKDGKPVEVDSNDTPRHEGEEEDFGLQRSTEEEAWEFYRQNLADDACGDDMTEFLDDE